MSSDDWRKRSQNLADDLDRQGVLGAGWRAAFEQVPRHVFVPSLFTDDDGVLDGSDPARREQWLDAVYSDTSLVTQRRQVPGTSLFLPTSSSTMPSLMARMLTLLNVSGDDHVLEIGTGTGYNAALLCHRLGDARVTSIDIDPGVVDAARTRLAQIGYGPLLVAGDGTQGVPARAPYTRIIATAAVGSVPAAWVGQLVDDGLAVVDVRGELASSLVVLSKVGPDALTGQFLGLPGHFMWLRAQADNPLRHAGTLNTHFNRDPTATTLTDIRPDDLEDAEFRFVLQLGVPGLQWIGRTAADTGEVVSITADDSSWVEVSTEPTAGKYSVTCGGPAEIWPPIVQAWHAWLAWGRPPRTRLGITTRTDGTQEVWLDKPDNRVLYAQQPV
jgi:protein-L-isoaspartate(D-aspartate) O-methyltransferase